MHTTPQSTKARNRRGSILLFTVVVLVVAGTTVVALTAAVTHNVHTVRRAEARLQSFYAAEAGIQQVIDWFNRPDVSPNPEYFKPLPSGRFVDQQGRSVLTLRNAGDYDIAESDLPVLHALSTDQSGNVSEDVERGDVVRILIEPPVEGEDPRGTVARVTSIGFSHVVHATVEARLYDNELPEIRVPAALITEGGAASNGLFQVHWGAVWAKDNIVLNNPINQKFPKESQDPWFAALTEALFEYRNGYADGRAHQGSADNPIEVGAPNYYIPFLESALDSQNNQLRGHENLQQHQNLDFPTMHYHLMKLHAMENDYPIFRSTADGRIIVGQDSHGNDIIMEFETFFDRLTHDNPGQVDRSKLPPLYFIDTIDGQPPRADNMATFQVAGNGPFMHGMFFVAAHLDFRGAGNSPNYQNPLLPDRTTFNGQIRNVRHYGLLYTYGTAEFSGQGSVYGAVYAEGGFLGGGNWDIYYDVDLDDPQRGRTGSRLRVNLWNTSFGYDTVAQFVNDD